jgi:hypothetical protein
VRPRVSPALQRRLAAALEEPEPTELGPARLKALKQASPDGYYAALGALRREDWRAFLGHVAPSKRRTALRALEDVVLDADMAALRRLLPPQRKRASPARR